jgi:hypothetical protein
MTAVQGLWRKGGRKKGREGGRKGGGTGARVGVGVSVCVGGGYTIYYWAILYTTGVHFNHSTVPSAPF